MSKRRMKKRCGDAVTLQRKNQNYCNAKPADNDAPVPLNERVPAYSTHIATHT